jgi:hypothetical protein
LKKPDIRPNITEKENKFFPNFTKISCNFASSLQRLPEQFDEYPAGYLVPVQYLATPNIRPFGITRYLVTGTGIGPSQIFINVLGNMWHLCK